jgi:predicted ATP-grasp superfamily ATP-dependent carboligase
MTRVGPAGLVRVTVDDAPGPGVLLHSLAGFLDAGSAGRLAVEHLLDVLPHQTVAEFDIDLLHDYRARRPRMTFLTDHYGEVDMPSLTVSKLEDSVGSSFFLLHGPEPDFRWRGFVKDTAWLMRELEVALVVGIHAVPWPAPHTRPVNVSAHSNNPALVADRRRYVGDLEVPGHVAGLIEITMRDAGIPAMGFAAHVPHYLVQSDYPRASVALLEAVSTATGLLLPLDGLRAKAEEADADIGLQVASDPEHIEAITALEAQYDAFMAQFAEGQTAGEEPDAAEFVSQVEQFLAERDAGEPD